MNEAMQKLIDAVQKASPIVWQAAYRQVWVDASEVAITMLLLFFMAHWMYQRRKALLAEKTEWGGRKVDSDDPAPVFLAVGVIVSVVLTVPCLWFVMDCVLNPTFAAIKELKGLL